LQQPEPEDYVIASGETHSVREFVEAAFSAVDLDYAKYVVSDPQFYRPAEVNLLHGDCSKAKRALGWSYSKSFSDLVREMVHADLAYRERVAGDRALSAG